MPIIKNDSFSGNSRIYDGTLADAIRNLAQIQAKAKAETLGDLTDNSGGTTADGTVPVIPKCTTTPGASDTTPTKAEVDAALVTAADAAQEVVDKLQAVAALVPAFSPTDSIGGAASDGTIGAITATFTGTDASGGTCVAKASLNTALDLYTVVLTNVGRDINRLMVACGQTEMDISALEAVYEARGGDYATEHTYAALTQATGDAATDGTESADDTEAEASFAAIADIVAEYADALNTLTAAGTVSLTTVAA